MDEIAFTGSHLESEIRNLTDIKRMETMHRAVKSALNNKPSSIFWKEAFNFIHLKWGKQN